MEEKKLINKKQKNTKYSIENKFQSKTKSSFLKSNKKEFKKFNNKDLKDNNKNSSSEHKKFENQDRDNKKTKSYSKYKGFNKKNDIDNDKSSSSNRKFDKKHFHSKDTSKFKKYPTKDRVIPLDKSIRLNKYIAHSGICSRRKADDYIVAGLVQVNDKIITEVGTKVKISDVIKYAGDIVHPEKLIYVLVNKPKNCITTMDDPKNRNTVFNLIEGKFKERIYPVGRLDRNTTGVLLMTNDGEISKKLIHPKYKIRKIYEVVLNENIKSKDFNAISEGIKLEDGFIKVEAINYVIEKDKKTLGIELHSGRNRIVRRIFEHLGYKVIKLDRTSFAGLTKQKLAKGTYRNLSDKEIRYLKML